MSWSEKTDRELWEALRRRHKEINDAANQEANAAQAGINSPITQGKLQPIKDKKIAESEEILDELERRFFG